MATLMANLPMILGVTGSASGVAALVWHVYKTLRPAGTHPVLDVLLSKLDAKTRGAIEQGVDTFLDKAMASAPAK